MKKYYLAVDIGASSGRHILGHLENGKIELEEIYRFENGMDHKDGKLLWDVNRLFGEIVAGMKKCKELGKIPVSMAIDTWAVDYVLLDEKDQILGDTYGYRDHRTDGMDAGGGEDPAGDRTVWRNRYPEADFQYRLSADGSKAADSGAFTAGKDTSHAAGLLRTSMRSKGFTLFLEPKALYNSVEAAAVVPEDFEVPFGKARIRREGSDLSIITYGNTTHFCLHAAERLEKEGGWKVEVIDIRSLIPLDKEAIFESVKKTSKALVVHEDKVFSGFGAELAAMISGEMFRYLDGPVQRVGSTFTPVGFNPILEKEILPDEAKIYEAARRLLEY